MKLTPLLSKAQLQGLVARLADFLQTTYKASDKPLVLVVPLKGAFVFAADLLRALPPTFAEVTFMKVHSYTGHQQGKIEVELWPEARDIRGRDVVVVEDIVDSGRTSRLILAKLRQMSPHSIKLCVLAERAVDPSSKPRADYVGIRVQTSLFLVGYGLDYNEKYRGLEGVFLLQEG